LPVRRVPEYQAGRVPSTQRRYLMYDFGPLPNDLSCAATCAVISLRLCETISAFGFQ